MELAAAAVGAVVTAAGQYLCGCACSAVGAVVTAAGQYLCGCACSDVKLQPNHGSLETEMKRLMELRADVASKLRRAEDQGQVIRADVVTWLENVENLLRSVNPIPGPPQCSLNCCQWYRANREVKNIFKEIKRLLGAGTFTNGVADPSPRAVEHIPVPSIRSQETASEILDKTMRLLSDDTVGRIGIWGPAGVGKTVLVKNLNNELGTTSMQPFSIVIWAEVSNWAEVSKDLIVKKVQTQIAKRLNLEVTADTMAEAAVKLHRRLMREEKFLLILDDVWKKIDLDTLGVPQPTVQNGCKMIFTSRSMEVCRKMEINADVKMDGLNDGEALQLFCEKADILNNELFKPFAEAITQTYCCGLPLVIVTVGAAMRRKTEIQWRDAFEELKRPVGYIKSFEKEVYKPLKLSYDSLQDDNTKSCFLCCCLFPKGYSIKITELEQYWLAEGLIDRQHSINGLINNLKDSCLLEDGANVGTVKMHDVIRDFAIWIASSSEEGDKSIVRSGIGLSEISVGEFSNADSLKRVSFMNNEITRLPDCEIQCPNASTLLLQGNRNLQIVPERFLKGFEALKVLNFSETNISSLPVSIKQFGDLRALLLRDCWFLEELPPLGENSRLEKLDLSGTQIRELPQEMEKLSNLQQLDLSHTDYLETIPAGIISELSCLEFLDMTDSAYELPVKIEEAEGKMTFEELRCLDHLLSLSIRLKKIPSLEDLSWINRLKSFQISIGPKVGFTTTNEKKVIVGCVDFSQESIRQLWGIAESLVLRDCLGLDEMLEDLISNSVGFFTGLKSLEITGADSFDRRVRVIGGLAAQHDLLPNLEELILSRLNVLESISELVGYLGLRFPKLKLIKVSDCSDMKYLLSCGGFIQTLPKLEVIKVSNCFELEELFNYDSGQNMAPHPVVPNLKILELDGLHNLTTLCRHEEAWLSLEQVEVLKCDSLKRLPLTNQNAGTIKEIKGESEWWNALVWDDDETKVSLLSSFCPV